ncbi:MAG: hypothetical protein H7Y33_14450 [Cytophagales bacterium]|nr:hypothetical protein [Rhizobacter sp.]
MEPERKGPATKTNGEARWAAFKAFWAVLVAEATPELLNMGQEVTTEGSLIMIHRVQTTVRFCDARACGNLIDQRFWVSATPTTEGFGIFGESPSEF